MLLAYYVHNINPFLIKFGHLTGIRWYGLAYVAAFLVGYKIYRHLSEKGYADIPPNRVADFITWWVVLGTLIGGRLGYMLFYNLDGLLQNPVSLLFVWQGGMSAHGGMIGLIVATYLYARRHKISWLNVGDNLVVTAPIGLFFGRCANFLNGELYGRPTTVPWAVQFPNEIFESPRLFYALTNETLKLNANDYVPPEVILTTSPRPQYVQEMLGRVLTPRHPSQLYEAALEGILLFILLWFLRTRFRLPNGVLTGIFFIGYAIARFSVEYFREPDAPLTLGLTRGQILSVLLLAIGLAFVLVAVLRPRYPKAAKISRNADNREQAPRQAPR